MEINKIKTRIVHFRNKFINRRYFHFKSGELCIDFAACYKYLGDFLNIFYDYSIIAKEMYKSANRAFDVIKATFCKTGQIALMYLLN